MQAIRGFSKKKTGWLQMVFVFSMKQEPEYPKTWGTLSLKNCQVQLWWKIGLKSIRIRLRVWSWRMLLFIYGTVKQGSSINLSTRVVAVVGSQQSLTSTDPQPHLLLVDGHTSQCYNIDFLWQNNGCVFALPPHTTHCICSQPTESCSRA